MTQTIPEIIFSELNQLIDFKKLELLENIKLTSSGYMPLVIERFDAETISMAHYYEVAGDLICDPDMVISIDHSKRTADAVSYQNGNFFQDVRDWEGKIINKKLQNSLNCFLLKWISNLKDQGFFEKEIDVENNI